MRRNDQAEAAEVDAGRGDGTRVVGTGTRETPTDREDPAAVPLWLRSLGSDSLRSQLLSGLTVLLVVALLAIAIALLLWLPEVPSPRMLLVGLLLLIAADVAVVVLFGDYLLRKQFLEPVDRMVAGAEAIASGDHSRRLEEADSDELRRLGASINRMADRLIRNQELLAENVRSLNETNEALTDAQEELIRAEKLASVGRLAAGIAHEVGNPLGAILGYVELARRQGTGGREEWLGEIKNEAQRIDRLVRGLLDYARPKAAAIRTVRVNEAVERALELLETQGQLRGVTTRFDLQDPSPRVRADPHHLEQVLVNLLLNARDAVEDPEVDGVIVLRTRGGTYRGTELGPRAPARRRDDPEGIDYSHLRRLGRRPSPLPAPGFGEGEPVVRIEVLDNGTGLPDGETEQLFDPFFTTKEPGRGTGLGLAVSARLVAGMGGAIEAASRSERGARFSVVLPAATEAEEDPTDGARAGAASLDGAAAGDGSGGVAEAPAGGRSGETGLGRAAREARDVAEEEGM